MKGKCVASAIAWAMVVFPHPVGPPMMKRGISSVEAPCSSGLDIWDDEDGGKAKLTLISSSPLREGIWELFILRWTVHSVAMNNTLPHGCHRITKQKDNMNTLH